MDIAQKTHERGASVAGKREHVDVGVAIVMTPALLVSSGDETTREDAPSAPDWCALNASTWHPGVAVNPLEGDGLVLSGGDDSPQPRPTPRRDSRRSLADLFESPPGGEGGGGS